MGVLLAGIGCIVLSVQHCTCSFVLVIAIEFDPGSSVFALLLQLKFFRNMQLTICHQAAVYGASSACFCSTFTMGISCKPIAIAQHPS